MKFLNCTLHELTEGQKKAIESLNCSQIDNLKDINQDLFKKLSNCPSDPEELIVLVRELLNTFKGYKYIHLPIGSPAFMWLLSIYAHDTRHLEEHNYLFSHSTRVSEEIVKPDGTIEKKQIFMFERFIEL